MNRMSSEQYALSTYTHLSFCSPKAMLIGDPLACQRIGLLFVMRYSWYVANVCRTDGYLLDAVLSLRLDTRSGHTWTR